MGIHIQQKSFDFIWSYGNYDIPLHLKSSQLTGTAIL